DIDGAESNLAKVERVVLTAPADGVLAETRHARGIIDLAAGRFDEAWEELRHLFEPDHPSHHETAQGWAISDLTDAAVATDNVGEASAVLRGLESDPVRVRMPWWRIGMAYARAVLLAHDGDPEAESAFAAALAMDLDGWPLARARLSLAWGIW